MRELENAIEHAFILCPSGLIQPQHLPEHLRPEPQAGRPHSGLTLDEIEQKALWEALERHQWRRMAVARELGIDKNTLRRKGGRVEAQAAYIQTISHEITRLEKLINNFLDYVRLDLHIITPLKSSTRQIISAFFPDPPISLSGGR